MVLLLVPLGLHPLLANVMAFLTAFQVSYFGHRYMTFVEIASRLQHGQTLPRFFAVAVSSFLLNELLFFLLLRFTSIPYSISMGIVLALVAGLTFVLSRHFVFAVSS